MRPSPVSRKTSFTPKQLAACDTLQHVACAFTPEQHEVLKDSCPQDICVVLCKFIAFLNGLKHFLCPELHWSVVTRRFASSAFLSRYRCWRDRVKPSFECSGCGSEASCKQIFRLLLFRQELATSDSVFTCSLHLKTGGVLIARNFISRQLMDCRVITWLPAVHVSPVKPFPPFSVAAAHVIVRTLALWVKQPAETCASK
jgi:hypothetical protein